MTRKVCPVCLWTFEGDGTVCGDACLVKAVLMENDFDLMQAELEKAGARAEPYAPLAEFVVGGFSGAPWEDELASAKWKGWKAHGEQ